MNEIRGFLGGCFVIVIANTRCPKENLISSCIICHIIVSFCQLSSLSVSFYFVLLKARVTVVLSIGSCMSAVAALTTTCS